MGDLPQLIMTAGYYPMLTRLKQQEDIDRLSQTNIQPLMSRIEACLGYYRINPLRKELFIKPNTRVHVHKLCLIYIHVGIYCLNLGILLKLF